MRARARRLAVLLGATAGALGLGACGIPTGGPPEALQADQIPYHLETGPTTPTTTTPVGPSTGHEVAYSIYLLDNGVLVPVRRLALKATPQFALDALAFGPTTSEFNASLSSALITFPPPHLRLTGPITKSGVARVALDSTTASLDPISLYEALGQIVLTLTQFCGIGEVSFTFNGAAFPAFLPNGTAPPTPVSRADYLEITPVQSATAKAHKPSCVTSS